MQQKSLICRNGSGTFLKKRRKTYPLMVEKKQSCERVEKDEESNNSESDSSPESTFHEQNLYIASFPLLASFALINYFSYLLFVLFRILWQHLIRLKEFLRPVNRSLALKENHESDSFDVSTQIEMASPATNENALMKQKNHHRKAFEFLSMALKIDEENEGMKYQ